jgi:hypothetical protein
MRFDGHIVNNLPGPLQYYQTIFPSTDWFPFPINAFECKK